MSKKKCPNCGACPECGAQPPYVVQPWPIVPRPYPYVPYTQPFAQPYPQTTWAPNTAGGFSGSSVSYSNPVNH